MVPSEQQPSIYSDKFESDLNSAIRENRATEFIENYISNPKNSRTDYSKKERFVLNLSECACLHLSRDHNNRRQKITKKITEHCKSAVKTSDTIKYMSIGCGGLLHDFHNAFHLLKNGNSIEIDLIDPKTEANALEQFKLLHHVATEKKTLLKINHYENFEEYIERNDDQKKLDIITAIDFEDTLKKYSAFSTIHKAKSKLSEEGKFYLSFHGSDLELNQTNLINNIYHYKSEAVQAIKKINFQSTTTINCAFLGDLHANFRTITYMLNKVASENITNVCLTLSQPKNTRKKFNTQELESFLKLFNPDINLNINFVDNTSQFIETAKDIKFNCIFWNEAFRKRKPKHIRALAKKIDKIHPNAHRYYDTYKIKTKIKLPWQKRALTKRKYLLKHDLKSGEKLPITVSDILRGFLSLFKALGNLITKRSGRQNEDTQPRFYTPA